MRLIEILVLTLSAGTVLAQLSAEKRLVAGTRTFAASLYKELIKTRLNQNVIFSPFTIQTVMSLLASASDNDESEVIKQIKNSLSLPDGKADRNKAFRFILDKLNDLDDDFKVLDATKIYLKSGSYTPEPTFINNARNNYRAEVEQVNFENNFQTSRDINDWVKNKTNGNITDLISQYDISRYTQNLMINSLYMLGKWFKPFLKEHNVPKIFKGPNNKNKMVTMMFNDNFTQNYYEDDDAQYLKLEILRAGDAFMVFVLPKNEQGLGDIENRIENFIKDDNFHGYESRVVSVTIPKFSIKDTMKLKPALQNIGVRKLFQRGAQLKELNYPGYVVVSDVAQKAIIDVNEWGVTAGAVAKAQETVDSVPNEPKSFIADHPFFFYITVDNAVVFAGRVMEVTQDNDL